jgi:hypothetical protein
MIDKTDRTTNMHLLLRPFTGSALWLMLLLGLAQTALAQETLSSNIAQGPVWSHSWVDVNADSRSDYCYLAGHTKEVLVCHFASAEGTYSSTASLSQGVGATGDGLMWWADVDGDGRADFCRAHGVSAPFSSAYAQDMIEPETGSLHGHAFSCRTAVSGFEAGLPGTYILGTSGSYALWNKFMLADVNGDRRTDLCQTTVNEGAEHGRVRCRLATGAGFSDFSPEWTSGIIRLGNRDLPSVMVDFSGDGFPDFCRAPEDGSLRCLLGSANGFTTTDVMSSAVDRGHAQGADFIDVNADGKTDYCRIVGNSASNHRLQCTLSTGIGWDTVNERISPVLGEHIGHASARWWIDINADGLSDFCRATGVNPDDPRDAVGWVNIDTSDTQGTLSCRLNKGDGSASDPVGAFYYSDVAIPVNFGAVGGARHWCDPTGSGIPTLCRNSRKQVFQTPDCVPSGGEGGSQPDSCTDPVVSETLGLVVGLGQPPTPGAVPPPQAHHPLLLAYTDGLGAETRITYLPLTSPEVYTSSGAGAYPYRVLGPPPTSPVVFETRAWTTEAGAAGSGLTLTGNARYAYRDLTQDIWAGASRGFRERWMFSEGTNTFDRTVFFQGLGDALEGNTPQGVPYGSIENDPREIGLVKFQERYTVDSNSPLMSDGAASPLRVALMAKVLSMIRRFAVGGPAAENPYLLLQRTDNRLADTSTPNLRYRYIGTSTVQSWDLDGTTRISLPGAATTTMQDQYGNVETLTQTRTQEVAGRQLTWSTTTSNTYDQDPKWLRLGRLKRSTVTSTAPSLDDQLAVLSRSAGGASNASAVSSPLAAVPQETPKPLPLPPQLLMPILQLLLDD